MESNSSNTNFGGSAPTNAEIEAAKKAFIHKRFIGPTTFGLIVLMFFFTFIDIKCNGVSLGTVKGYELATGYSLTKHDDTKHNEKPNIYAAAAMFFAVIGFGLGFIKAT